MKLAFVSDAIWPYNKGGKEKRLFEVTTRLAKKGHDVHIYTMQWWSGEKVKTENNVTLHAISPLYPLYSGERRSIKEALLFGLSCFRLMTFDFSLADVDSMPYIPLYIMKLVCVIKRKKMVATWHEVWSREYWKSYAGTKGTLAYFIEKYSSLLPNTILSVSKTTTKQIGQYYGRSKNVETIGMGIDHRAIQKVQPSKTKSDILFAGRLLKHKHVDLLIEAVSLLAKTHPDIRCLIIGEGPEQESLSKKITALHLGKNIRMLGRVEHHTDLYGLMKASKVFVLPSDREGFGLVVLEANACGIPVVTVDKENNAAKDLISTGKNGYIAKLEPKDLALQVQNALSSKWKKNNVEKTADAYDWDSIVHKIESVYK